MDCTNAMRNHKIHVQVINPSLWAEQAVPSHRQQAHGGGGAALGCPAAWRPESNPPPPDWHTALILWHCAWLLGPTASRTMLPATRHAGTAAISICSIAGGQG